MCPTPTSRTGEFQFLHFSLALGVETIFHFTRYTGSTSDLMRFPSSNDAGHLSCAYLPSVHLVQGEVSSWLLPTFWSGSFFFYCRVFWVQNLLSVCGLPFHLLAGSSYRKFFQFYLPIFLFMDCSLGANLIKPWVAWIPEIFCYVFFLKVLQCYICLRSLFKLTSV